MSAKYPQRKIGDTSVSAMGLGCMSFSIPDATGALPLEEDCLQVLTAAADAGITLWITSDMYGQGHNESILGKWFRLYPHRRSEIFLVTKFGVKLLNMKPTLNSSPESVKQACAASLERLGVDKIDMYMQHRVDPNVPIEKTMEALVELRKEGKIGYMGLSECSARTLERASKIHAIAAAEMEYSVFALDIEDPSINFLSTARKLGVKIIAYSPLGRGFLTGAIKKREDVDAMRRQHPRFSEENFSQNLKIVDVVEDIAKVKRLKPGNVALAWALAQGEDIIPIPGTKRVKYLEENIQAVHVELSADQQKRIREAAALRVGARYPEAHMSSCFADSPELESI